MYITDNVQKIESYEVSEYSGEGIYCADLTSSKPHVAPRGLFLSGNIGVRRTWSFAHTACTRRRQAKMRFPRCFPGKWPSEAC